jgi:hypothetical protein
MSQIDIRLALASRRTARTRSAWLLVALAACEPALDQRLAIVRAPRVLAVVSEPAELVPGASATYSAIVAAPGGPVADAPAWALCTAPKPPTEDDAVSQDCVADAKVLVPLGAAPTVTATVPADACTRFGPDVVGSGFRPRDPDATGGFYQPVRVDASDAGAPLAFGFTRIVCHLANAPGDVAHEYETTYVANANPTLLPLALEVGGSSIAADAVPAGGDVALVASWRADAVESYVYFDPGSQTLVTRREAMRVSWFATAGALDVDATAVGEDDPATSASTTWHAPTSGTAWLWIVLRDSRGGVAAQAVAVTVR